MESNRFLGGIRVKLGDVKNPVTGQNISLSPGNLLSMVLGGVVILALFGVVQRVFGIVRGAVPGAAGWMGSGAPFVRPAEQPSGPSINIIS
jgi:hypothetical protein